MSKPRIRSIKPEFWVDPKIAKLPKGTALFFIALWNFADDQGIIEDDSRSLALRIPIYRSQDIQKMLNALWQEGLIKRSPSVGLVLITGWRHQKIDRPRDGKWNPNEIKWMTWSDSTKGRDESRVITAGSDLDRIGSDRKGSLAKGAKPPSRTAEVWRSYKSAYAKRYGAEPPHNSRLMGQLAQFVQRVPAEEAPLVAEFYLTHGDQFYLKNMHPVGLMLKDAEKLRTEWITNRKMTSQNARGQEQVDHVQSQLDRIARGEL